MFTAQLQAAALRGALVTVLVGLGAFGALYTSHADSHVIVGGVIAACVPVALGFLGFGLSDGKRAVAVARGDASQLHPSDVGYHAPPPAPPIAPPTPIVAPAVPLASGPHPE